MEVATRTKLSSNKMPGGGGPSPLASLSDHSITQSAQLWGVLVRDSGARLFGVGDEPLDPADCRQRTLSSILWIEEVRHRSSVARSASVCDLCPELKPFLEETLWSHWEGWRLCPLSNSVLWGGHLRPSDRQPWGGNQVSALSPMRRRGSARRLSNLRCHLN